MKKSLFLLLLMLAAFAGDGYAQCKYKGVPRKLQRYCVSDTKPKPDAATRLSVLFDKVYFVGQAGFAKSGNQYYLYLHLARNYSRSFSMSSQDPLVLTTASGKVVKAYPAGNYSGRHMVTWYAIGCYYSLTREQLQTLATEDVESLQIQINSEEPIDSTPDDGSNGWHQDAAGNYFFRHDIESEAKKERCREAAKCMLAK